MRWNCPHCSVNLAIADDKIGAGWSFARCYRCGGFALVRRAEVNIIKVDRAPEGEKILLPENSEQPLLSQEATRNLARYTSGTTSSPAKPSIRTATLRSAKAQAAPTPAARPTPRIPEAPSFLRQKSYTLWGRSRTAAAVEEALPEENALPPVPPPFTHLPPPEMEAYAPDEGAIEAQEIPPAELQPQAIGGPRASEVINPIDAVLPEPLPELPPTPVPTRLLPVAMGIAAAIAVGSGIYLYVQGQALWEKARTDAALRTTRLSRTEPAPISREPASAIRQVSTVPQELAAAAPVRVPVRAQMPYTDQVHNQAMAPKREFAAPPVRSIPTAPMGSPVARSFIIETRANNVRLRSGPGLRYPVIAIADRNTRYVVTDWSSHWFRVLLKNPDNMPPDPNFRRKTAWIQTESVQVVASNSRSR